MTLFFILLKVSTDEEKEKGCLCLAPGMLDISEENTQEMSFGMNENVVPAQSNVTSPRKENHVVDIASRSLSSTGVTNSSNNCEVIGVTDPEINEQPTSQQVKNLSAAVDVSPDKKEFFVKLEEKIDLKDCLASVNMDNLKMLSLLDFAGHSAYYACHHIFFSPRAFFILVVDMTKDLRSVATEACRKEGLIYGDWTYAGRLLFLY